MSLLSDTFLITDVDGTLLGSDHKISAKNLAAIRELRAAGGKFTIASGRGMSMARPIADELSIDCAAVLFNGAVVYDFGKNEMLWESVIADSARRYLAEFMRFMPSCAAEVLIGETVYVPRCNAIERAHLALGKVNAVFLDVEEIPKENWTKALIVDTPDNIDRIVEFADTLKHDDAEFIRSQDTYYEILPKGVNKGRGLAELLNREKRKDWYVVTAGDFYNDVALVKMADLGVAVGNAIDEVKDAAGLVVSDNDHDAIYEIVEFIKQKG